MITAANGISANNKNAWTYIKSSATEVNYDQNGRSFTYEVKYGNTLSSIFSAMKDKARKSGQTLPESYTIDDFARENEINDKNRIIAGKQLKIALSAKNEMIEFTGLEVTSKDLPQGAEKARLDAEYKIEYPDVDDGRLVQLK